MGLRQEIPDELKCGPVTVAEAERLCFSRQRFRGPNWRRLGWGTYVWTGLGDVPNGELVALHRRLPPGCVFSGRTAAMLLGIDVDGDGAVEVTRPRPVSVRARPGLSVVASALDPEDVTTRGSLPVTSPHRTCFDLARRLALVEAVSAVDSALHRRLVSLPDIRAYVARRTRQRGLPRHDGSSTSSNPTRSRRWSRACV